MHFRNNNFNHRNEKNGHAAKKFITCTKKFYVHEIAALNLSKISS